MDFIILTVNGVDVSQCSHEEAVARFLEAQEPIMVEVKRRGVVAEKEVDKEVEEEREEQYSSGRESEEGPLIYPDLEYEEIELVRGLPSERLGLTLCYEDEDSEGNTEIFIDDIAPEGLAARDGRLRLGDQIIQINGVRVRTKAAAQETFLTVTGDVRLLVVRPPQLGGGYEEDLDNLLDLSESVSSQKQQLSKNRLSSTSSKDSGHTSGTIDRSTTASSTSASSKTSEEAAEAKSDAVPKTKPSAVKKSPVKNAAKSAKSDLLYSTDSEFYYVDGKLEQISDFYRELKHRGVQEIVPTTTDSMNNYIDPIYEMIPEASEAEETLYCLPQDSRMARPAPAPRADKRLTKSQEKLRSLCRSISSPMRMNEYLMSRVKRSSSNHSATEPEIALPEPARGSSRTQGWGREEAQKRVEEPATSRSLRPEPSLRLGDGRTGSTLSLVGPAAPSTQAGVTYTNLDNLERTIRLQQERLLREREEERLLRPRFAAPPPPVHPPPAPHEIATAFREDAPAATPSSSGTWEWKVKVRPDGSRYVARRPVRSLQLRERGRRIEEERGGNTTDDDAVSEVGKGRFWTKDERKRQFEAAKERRRRQEELIRAKTVSLRQGGGGPGGVKRLSYQEAGGPLEPVLVATV